ncbi:peptidoglycan-binding protein [Clostridium sp. KNHs214]|uniref:peptidoglycan-binding protein n=1 Tax=Clostridium sp. KNHs214 TaxID=1540257 RepID=UPI000AC555EE|nr:peptidoglycan-binding protein [Clostridium sp. KNHs214]
MNIIETEVSRRLKGLPHNNYPSRIVLHHAEATNCTVEDIDRWHRGRGWQGIGYHYFVRKDGQIYKGRPDYTMGAHCLHNNTNTIGICAEGKYMVETMPEVQKQAIISLCKSLGIKDIKGHRELNSTDCPGRNYPLEEIRNAVVNGKASTSTTKTAPSATSDTSVRDKIGVITGNGVNVRLDAGMDGAILGSVNKGDKVTLWSLEGEWYHCYSLYKGYNRCYIHKDYVKIINEAAISKPVQTKQETWQVNINGDIIRELQNELNIQYNAGIKVDGWAGDITIDHLPVVRQGAKGNITRIIQKILLLKGYKLPKYGADGTFGEEMKAAVLQFQKANGLSVDGVVGINTWKVLLRA